jgi:hypothetical protein
MSPKHVALAPQGRVVPRNIPRSIAATYVRTIVPRPAAVFATFHPTQRLHVRTTDPHPAAIVMDTILSNAQSSAAFTGMNSVWGPDSYISSHGTLDFADADLSMPLGVIDENPRCASAEANHRDTIQTNSRSLSFVDAMSPFTNQEPADQKPHLPATTIDPMSMWPESNEAWATPSTTSRHGSAYSSSGTPKSTGTAGRELPGMIAYPSSGSLTTAPAESPEMQSERIASIQPESDSTCRARYAANQRHQKARNLRQADRETSSSTSTSDAHTKVEEKKRNLREKNKVAAAKCRQRQRKQAETIRARGSRLSETNAQLKSYVQELRRELNGLRSLALGHGECEERLARYNRVQAERVMRDYYSACGGLAGSMMNNI